MSFERQSSIRPRFSSAAFWVILCAYLNFAGWVLTILHQLNAVGYAVTLSLGLAAMAIWKTRTKAVFLEPQDFTKWRRRFRRTFPLAFLILGILAIAGGVLHPPANYDGLAYRTPRVLSWLAEGRWHWIHTDFNRLNTRSPAYEWMTAPLIALLRTDRIDFLICAISFLLLPGRVFSIWTRLGVRPRVAWYWMWLFPSGYCYLLQAGSIGNDLFGALLAMAAIEFALRARRSGRIGELMVAILAAGLMTSGKAFNLLLGLPWVVAAGPALWLLLRRPLIAACTLFVAASVSLAAIGVLNYHYCGDWTGQKAENMTILGAKTPGLHMAANAVLLTVHNFVPPIFPFTKQWDHLVQRAVPAGLAARLDANFEVGGAKFEIGEMQMEESAGIGLGICALLVITFLYRWRFRSKAGISSGGWTWELFTVKWLVPIATYCAMLVFMAEAGFAVPARFMSPFYPLLAAPILAGDGAILQLLRRAWWRTAAMVVFAVAAIVVILTPPRPLWPAIPVLKAMGAEKSSNALVRRAWAVYSVYADRADAFAPVVAILPKDASPLGMVTSDDPETSLWRPFGSRVIEHVCSSDDAKSLRDRNIKYVLVNSYIVNHHYQTTMDAWLQKYDCEVVQPVTLSLRATMGPVQWWLVKVR